ncbi:MAG: glycosyltransferase family 39 protein [Acidimicrobiia bacterium]
MTRPRFAPALGAVVAVAAVIRVLAVTVIDPHVPALGDASAYHLLANNLADGLGYIRPFDLLEFHLHVPTAEYPPLHPFVLSLFARLGLRSVEAQRLVLAAIGSGTVAWIGVTGRRLAGARVGLVAAGLAAVSPMFFLADATLMSETLYAFLVATALFLALGLRADPTPARAAVLGLVLGLAVLTRAEAGVLALLLFAPLLFRSGLPMLRRLVPVGVGLLAVVVVVLPWTLRNQSTFHQLVPVSNNLGTALAGANCDPTYSGPSLGSWRSTFGHGDAAAGQYFTGFNGHQPHFNEAKAAAAARRRGLTYAGDHAGDLPEVGAARVLRTFGLFRPSQQIELEALEGRPLGWERVGTWFDWALLPLAFGGFVVMVRGRAAWWPPLATVISVVVTSLLTYGNQRFRIGAEPALVLAAAVALVALTDRPTRGHLRFG